MTPAPRRIGPSVQLTTPVPALVKSRANVFVAACCTVSMPVFRTAEVEVPARVPPLKSMFAAVPLRTIAPAPPRVPPLSSRFGTVAG